VFSAPRKNVDIGDLVFSDGNKRTYFLEPLTYLKAKKLYQSKACLKEVGEHTQEIVLSAHGIPILIEVFGKLARKKGESALYSQIDRGLSELADDDINYFDDDHKKNRKEKFISVLRKVSGWNDLHESVQSFLAVFAFMSNRFSPLTKSFCEWFDYDYSSVTEFVTNRFWIDMNNEEIGRAHV
jgi:hypothetical protein